MALGRHQPFRAVLSLESPSLLTKGSKPTENPWQNPLPAKIIYLPTAINEQITAATFAKPVACKGWVSKRSTSLSWSGFFKWNCARDPHVITYSMQLYWARYFIFHKCTFADDVLCSTLKDFFRFPSASNIYPECQKDVFIAFESQVYSLSLELITCPK